MIVIPAVDIRGGKCVRLRQGRAQDETVFSENPVAMARKWSERGAQFLHVVDLDGAFAGEPVNLELARRIAEAVDCPVELGGGLRTEHAVADALAVGVERVVVGTRAATDRNWLRQLLQKFEGKVAVGIDARDGIVSLKGWTESSQVRALDMVDELNDLKPAAIIYTDIARDGQMEGPNIKETALVAKRSMHPVIASGGVSRLEDIRALTTTGASAVIVGRALYEGTVTLEEAIEAAG